MKEIRNNIVKDNRYISLKDNINSTDNISKANILNLRPNFKLNNLSIFPISNDSSNIISNSINSSKKPNNNLIFSFKDEDINNINKKK